jgi:F-type H+-transporting ATPase subunit b
MEQLGIEPKLLLAQIVNFLIIVFVLTKVLYKPVLAMLEKRRKEIAEGLAISERMHREEEKFQEKKAAMLDVARKEAKALIEEAKKRATDVEKDLVEKAHKQASEIVEKGKIEVARERTSMEKSLRTESINLAVVMAQKLLHGILSEDMQHKLVSTHLKDLDKVQMQ